MKDLNMRDNHIDIALNTEGNYSSIPDPNLSGTLTTENNSLSNFDSITSTAQVYWNPKNQAYQFRPYDPNDPDDKAPLCYQSPGMSLGTNNTMPYGFSQSPGFDHLGSGIAKDIEEDRTELEQILQNLDDNNEEELQRKYQELIVSYGELSWAINTKTEELKQLENYLIETHQKLTVLVEENPSFKL